VDLLAVQSQRGAHLPFPVINATMRPAAGIMGLVSHPMHGAWEDTSYMFHGKEVHTLRRTRICDGIEAVRRSTSEQRTAVLTKFEELKAQTAERQQAYHDMVHQVLDERLDSSSQPMSSQS
jgi:sterol 3beta-glucosyltransferase